MSNQLGGLSAVVCVPLSRLAPSKECGDAALDEWVQRGEHHVRVELVAHLELEPPHERFVVQLHRAARGAKLRRLGELEHPAVCGALRWQASSATVVGPRPDDDCVSRRKSRRARVACGLSASFSCSAMRAIAPSPRLL